MGIGEDIQQKTFTSNFNMAMVNIMYTSSWLHQKQQELFKPNRLTTPQYNILRILRGQYPRPCTVNLLIDRMLDKSSNASRIVDRLEQKGLVSRKQCADDRRAVDVLISNKGLTMLDRMDAEMKQWEERLRNLTEEEAILLNELLDKMRS